MPRNTFVGLAVATLVLPLTLHAAEYAESVIAYNPGVGFATDSTGQGFTNAAAALGQPSRVTPGTFGGPVDPFNPPYLTEQVVSIGAGGSLTVQFTSPILNSPDHRFGLDFSIYGNSGFMITNANYSGGGITDGSLFGANPGTTRVFVSADNINYFQLDPARAPVVDTLFPTDGAGSFDLSVDQSLSNARFAGLGLDGIRSLYNGAAGGAGFDISWAQDASGQSVTLPAIRFIRVDVVDGVAEVDGFAAPGLVPEPTSWVLLAAGSVLLLLFERRSRKKSGRVVLSALLCVATVSAANLQEDFSSDPAATGWRSSGETGLFQWDPVEQNLVVTWDSSRPNSYFYHSLGTILAKSDDVQLSFDLRLADISALNPDKPFELAVGLINLNSATSTNFVRGTGTQSPNLLEFDYFPPSNFGATISPIIISSNNQWAAGFAFPLELTVNDLFHVKMRYSATSQTLTTTLQRNAEPFGAVKDVKLGSSFTDFQVDAVAISSYSDRGTGGALLAHGRIDNLVVVAPDPPLLTVHGALVSDGWRVTFPSSTNWVYTLERTVDWQQWQPVSDSVHGTGGEQVMQDKFASASSPAAFYRVRVDKL